MKTVFRRINEGIQISDIKKTAFRIQRILNLTIFIALFEISILRTIIKYVGDQSFLPDLYYFNFLRTIIKYVGNPSLLSLLIILSYLFLLFFIIYLFTSRRSIIDHLSNIKYLYVLSVLAITIIILYGYPIADGLKLHGRGSDQDDCVILGVEKLLKAQNPYSERSYLNGPCSTGMGVLIAYIPFVYIGFYELGSVIFMIITLWYLYINRGSKLAFFYKITLLTNILFIELMVVGSDLFLIGFFLLIAALYMDANIDNMSIGKTLLLSVLVGLVASSRINMLIILPIFAIFGYFRNKLSGILMFLSSSVIAILPSFLIYISNPSLFTPLHLIQKAEMLLPLSVRFVVIAIMAFSLVISLFLYSKKAILFTSALLWILTPMFVGLLIGGLAHVEYKVSLSEHFNYLIPLLPLASASCLISLQEGEPK
jgi:hypothetical protein